jgi:hypothetical protein
VKIIYVLTIIKNELIMENSTSISFWDKIFGDAEFNRYSIISMTIIVIGCLGGITVGMGAVNSIFQIIMVVFPTMMGLALILGMAPMKYILNVCALAIIIDILLLIYNLVIVG